MVAFSPEAIPAEEASSLQDLSNAEWTPLLKHSCSFSPEIFREVMLNLIRNPNINSNHLFRADIALDTPFSEPFEFKSKIAPRICHFKAFDLKTVMIRTMVPRNPKVDKPLDQTCLLYEKVLETGESQNLVIYLPHISTPSESPFYHPAVHGIAFLHTFHSSTKEGIISIEYSFFPSSPRSPLLERTAQHLLSALHKHGQGTAAGYKKRVHHDVIIPQASVQNTYAQLKAKFARPMIEAWVEDTDPGKHVFEDLGIAAFLIELWAEMYEGKDFPGFVDIGCGNGLLVHILLEEGYQGWGFDARARKSWAIYGSKARENLHQFVLIPSIIQSEDLAKSTTTNLNSSLVTNSNSQKSNIHNGLFPSGTFIISNHADELTPWTPILANLSQSPFMAIPCCSHALTGARFRAPPSKKTGASNSAYASLVDWVSKIGEKCGWKVETEMLRIPSTRNTALIGRNRSVSFGDVDTNMRSLVEKFGGAVGWEENAMKLVSATKGH